MVNLSHGANNTALTIESQGVQPVYYWCIAANPASYFRSQWSERRFSNGNKQSMQKVFQVDHALYRNLTGQALAEDWTTHLMTFLLQIPDRRHHLGVVRVRNLSTSAESSLCPESVRSSPDSLKSADLLLRSSFGLFNFFLAATSQMCSIWKKRSNIYCCDAMDSAIPKSIIWGHMREAFCLTFGGLRRAMASFIPGFCAAVQGHFPHYLHPKKWTLES